MAEGFLFSDVLRGQARTRPQHIATRIADDDLSYGDLDLRARRAAIIARVREHIAGYKAPKSVDFIDVIPRNLAGKIRRRDLRQPYWADRARAVN